MVIPLLASSGEEHTPAAWHFSYPSKTNGLKTLLPKISHHTTIKKCVRLGGFHSS
jgi:hypothetical protein